MQIVRLIRKPLVVAALLTVSAASHAAITVYTAQASFLAAVSAPGVDTFTGLSLTDLTPSPITRSAGAYGYTASAPDGFFGAGTAANPYLSTNTAANAITFGGFTGGVAAIGGNFFGTNVDGAFSTGSITMLATDSLGASVTQTIAGSLSGFLGFVSAGAMSSLVLSSVQPPNDFLWPAADNLTLAAAAISAPVPEPETYALLLGGLGLLGFISRRRRAA